MVALREVKDQSRWSISGVSLDSFGYLIPGLQEGAENITNELTAFH